MRSHILGYTSHLFNPYPPRAQQFESISRKKEIYLTKSTKKKKNYSSSYMKNKHIKVANITILLSTSSHSGMK